MNGMTYFEVNTTASASSVRVQPVTGRRYFDATAPAPNACASSAVGYATILPRGSSRPSETYSGESYSCAAAGAAARKKSDMIDRKRFIFLVYL